MECLGSEFFERPESHFKTYVEQLYKSRDTEQFYKFLSLVIIWSEKTQTIKEEDLQNPSQVSAHVRRVADCFGVEITHSFIETLKLSLNAYTKFLLLYINKSGEYAFTHRVIGEMVGVVLGEHRPRECIQLCHRDFLMERITTTETDQGYIKVIIPPNLESVLIQKFVQMICRDGCNFTKELESDGLDPDILKHEVFESECFAEAFILNVINNTLEEKLFHVPLHPFHYYTMRTPFYLLEFTLRNKLFTLAKQIVCHIKQLFTDTKYVSVKSIDAVMQKFPELFETLVEFREAKINEVFSNESLPTTLLSEAARNNLTYAVLVLLKYGANPNCAGPVVSALHRATENGNHEFVKLLLKRGALVNAKTTENVTPLHAAAIGGHHTIVEVLLQHAAEKNAKDINGYTSLHEAAWNGHHGIVEVLLQHGAEINVKDGEGITPLHYAAEKSHHTAVEVLLQHGADVNVKDVNDITPLENAACGGHHGIVEVLLQHGANVNVVDCEGFTPLHEAARYGHHTIAEVLLRHGADVDIKDEEGITPLHDAAGNGHHATMEVLPQQGMDINVEVDYGTIYLHEAALNDHYTTVEILLQHGAKVNNKDRYGITPLHRAAQLGHQGIVEILMQHETEVNVKDIYGITPLHRAAQFGHQGIVEILMQHEAEVNVVDCEGITPLHEAAQYGNHGIVDILLQHGAKPDVKDNEGITPLYNAVLRGHHMTVEALLSTYVNKK